MKAVDDSIAQLLARVDASTTDLRVRVEQRERNLEALSASNPSALARLTSVVDEYVKMKDVLRAKDDTIATLRERIRGLVAENRRLRAEVSRLSGRVASRDSSIQRSDSVLKAANERLATTDTAMKSYREKLTAGYVLIAERGELERLGVIGKTNRFGLGSEVLKKVDPSMLRKINTATDLSFEVPASASKVKVLSQHGEGSFVVAPDGTGSRIQVQNADAFWAASRVLVVAF